MPAHWRDAAFEDLRAEGGHRVSARREGGVTTWFRVVAGRNGGVRIRDNFGGRELTWSVGGVRKVGRDFEVRFGRGESIEATLSGAPQDM
jgi:alpha-L-fucosidase 2